MSKSKQPTSKRQPTTINATTTSWMSCAKFVEIGSVRLPAWAPASNLPVNLSFRKVLPEVANEHACHGASALSIDIEGGNPGNQRIQFMGIRRARCVGVPHQDGAHRPQKGRLQTSLLKSWPEALEAPTHDQLTVETMPMFFRAGFETLTPSMLDCQAHTCSCPPVGPITNSSTVSFWSHAQAYA